MGGANCAGVQGTYDPPGMSASSTSRDADVQPVCFSCPTGEDDDGDGVCGAADGCPLDPNKAAPGLCGCGVPDTDSDEIPDWWTRIQDEDDSGKREMVQALPRPKNQRRGRGPRRKKVN